MLSWQSSDGALGASRWGVSRGGGVSRQGAKRTSARDLSAKSASGRDTQFMDQGEVWATPVQRAWIEKGGDGGVVGVSDLQHPGVDTSALETSSSGAVWIEGNGEKGRVAGRIASFEPLSSCSTVRLRVITAQAGFF